MRHINTRMRVLAGKRKLFLVALTAISSGGCASSTVKWLGRSKSPPAISPVHSPPVESGTTSDLSWDKMLVDSVNPPELIDVAPVGFKTGSNGSDSSSDGFAQAIRAVNEDFDESGNDVSEMAQPVEHFVGLALAQHPSIQAARQRVSAETNRIPQARALPDPQFMNTFWPIQDQSLQTAAGRVGNQMSLSQSIPWPEKLQTKASIVSQEVQIARAEVERIEREITESVRLAYYEVWFSTRAIAIANETKELINDLTVVAEACYSSGGTRQDVLRARLESDRLDNQLISLKKQKGLAQADLAALVQQPVTLIAETSEVLSVLDVPTQLDDLIALAEHYNPQLKGLAWELQRDRKKQRLACLQKYPDLQVGLNWGLVSDGTNVISPVANGHDQINFSVGTTLPIWKEKINGGVREAAHRTSSTTRRLDAERDALFGKLRRLLAQADAFYEQRDIYQTRIIPRAEDTLKLSIADYRGQRTDFFSLIETYRELLMFETQLAKIDAALAGTLAQIERAVGYSPR